MRAGKRTANIIWGNPSQRLVGDFLFSRAFELMVEDGSLKVLRILSHASAVIAEGEVDQLTAQRQVETSEEHYLHIINAKTAACSPPPAGSRRSSRGRRGAKKR
jgi:octaprenyl-diphosphate synthase